jgi:IS605 OrfB family transposase
MKTQRSIPIVIDFDSDIAATITEFTHLENLASPVCYNGGQKPLSQLKLHENSYHQLKGKIPSQLTCSVFRLVAGAYVGREKALAKTNRRRAKQGRTPRERKVIVFGRQSAVFLMGERGRDASFRKNGIISVSTGNGCKKVNYRIPAEFQKRFDDAISYDSLNLALRDGKIIGKLAITLDFPEPAGISPVGVDLNANLLIVAADADDRILIHSGREVKILNKKSRQGKKRLRTKVRDLRATGGDTHSVRRALERLGSREANRTRNECRVAAKELTNWAAPNSIVVLEDLKLKPKSRHDHGEKPTTRRKLNSFPHRQLRTAIEAKCQSLGIPVVFINPYLTSQKCNRCGSIGVRKLSKFECVCGYVEHSDINAARNIRDKFVGSWSNGVSVNDPRSPLVGGKPAT